MWVEMRRVAIWYILFKAEKGYLQELCKAGDSVCKPREMGIF